MVYSGYSVVHAISKVPKMTKIRPFDPPPKKKQSKKLQQTNPVGMFLAGDPPSLSILGATSGIVSASA